MTRRKAHKIFTILVIVILIWILGPVPIKYNVIHIPFNIDTNKYHIWVCPTYGITASDSLSGNIKWKWWKPIDIAIY